MQEISIKSTAEREAVKPRFFLYEKTGYDP